MWKYIKRYFHFAILAGLFMIGKVIMDLVQPELMSKIVDNGVLGIDNSGSSYISIILALCVKTILLVIFNGFCGSMNNVFVHSRGRILVMQSEKTVSAVG